jgi:transcriptional regulator with XRE-family HTH domain
MDPGALLRDARLRHGLGQRSLARRAGTSQAQISRIERGEISPSVSTLDRLLAVMGERLELVALPETAIKTGRPTSPPRWPNGSAKRQS